MWPLSPAQGLASTQLSTQPVCLSILNLRTIRTQCISAVSMQSSRIDFIPCGEIQFSILLSCLSRYLGSAACRWHCYCSLSFRNQLPLVTRSPDHTLFLPQNQLASFQICSLKSQTGQNLLCLSGSSVGTSRNNLWKCIFALYWSENKTEMSRLLVFLWNLTHFNCALNRTIHFPSLIMYLQDSLSDLTVSNTNNASETNSGRQGTKASFQQDSWPAGWTDSYNHDAAGGQPSADKRKMPWIRNEKNSWGISPEEAKIPEHCTSKYSGKGAVVKNFAVTSARV